MCKLRRLHKPTASFVGLLVLMLSVPPVAAAADEPDRKASGAGAEVERGTRATSEEIVPLAEKRILWEDRGDRLVISLPKERIATASSTVQTGSPAYATAVELAVGLAAMSAHGVSTIGTLAGNIAGQVLQAGRPLVGCRVRLLPIPRPITEPVAARVSTEETDRQLLETTPGNDGVYRFEHIPAGEYHISWLAPGASYWQGRLSAQPDVTVKADETSTSDIEL